MAAYNIRQHFKGLRVQTARKRGRDPFATGFEDDSSDDDNFSRSSTTKSKVVPAADPLKSGTTTTTTRLPDSTANTLIRDSEDEFLDPPKRQPRQPSPAPLRLNGGRRASIDRGSRRRKSANRAAVALAAGPLAYLDETTDDSDEDQPTLPPPSRSDRYPSPAPRSNSDPDPPRLNPPRHTVASPFAGTKYLQDSESDSDEEAVVSRQGSADSTEEAVSASPPRPHLEVQRVDKPKSHGSEVSWRAFSTGRAEQRAAELTALQTSLEQRGWSISFADFAATDDGARIPTATTPPKITATARGRPNLRRKSPPRRPVLVDAGGAEGDDGDADRKDHPDPSKYSIDAVAALSVKPPGTIANGLSAKLESVRNNLPNIRINHVANSG